jgi:hypothetical protein
LFPDLHSGIQSAEFLPEPALIGAFIQSFFQTTTANEGKGASPVRQTIAFALSSCALLFAGCSQMPDFTSTNTPATSGRGASFHGIVHGGQQPISGSHVYLYGVGDTGYGQSSVSLLTSNSGTSQDGSGNYYVTTDSNGNWSVTGDYTCPAANSFPYTYALAVGGNAGSGNNSAITLMAPVGGCTQSNYTSTYVVVNEVSTIALAYSAAGFAVDPAHVSSPNNTMANTGLSNVNTYNLYTQSTGVALATTPAGNGRVPQAEIDTLANILAACVNSTGSGSTQCATLFANAKNGNTAPSDTATAAVNIAHNPGANVANLFGLQTAQSPFQPVLSAAPSDFTLALTYTNANMDLPQEAAIDSSGNVWVSNSPKATGLTDNFLFQFASDGTLLSGANGDTGGGLNYPTGIAIDGNGNVWLSNASGNSVSEFNSSGAAKSGSSGYTGAGMDDPWQIAIDSSNNAWMTNVLSAAIVKVSPTGAVLSGSSGYTGSGFSDPFYLAIDTSGNAWISDDTFLDELSPSGSVLSGANGFSGGGLNYPGQVAIDAAGNVWAANDGAGSGMSISELSSSGAALSGGGYTGGGLDVPQYLAIDGNGAVWVLNTDGNSLSEFSSSGTAITGSNGYVAGLNNPGSIAIDSTGNVWVVSSGSASLVEFVGLASPVVTPVVANLQSPYGSHAVNKP